MNSISESALFTGQPCDGISQWYQDNSQTVKENAILFDCHYFYNITLLILLRLLLLQVVVVVVVVVAAAAAAVAVVVVPYVKVKT
jgi:hypothetical protein